MESEVMEEDTDGSICSIHVRNFFCHDNLQIDLNKNVNFVVGRNGSGKSAILTALVVGLGGRASATNRGNNLHSFIKKGANSATVEIKIKNSSGLAYKHDVYGDYITIARTINASGGSSYKVKNASGEVVSTKFEEVNNIVTAHDIQVDNPISVLNQDDARSFHASDAKKKFTLFRKATNMDRTESNYSEALENCKVATNTWKRKSEVLEVLEKEYKKLKAIHDRLQSHSAIKAKEKELENEYYWSEIVQYERDAKAIEEKHNKQQGKIDRLVMKLTELEQSYGTNNGAIDALKTQLEQHAQQREVLEQELAELEAQTRQATTALRGLQAAGSKHGDSLRREQRKVAELRREIQSIESGDSSQRRAALEQAAARAEEAAAAARARYDTARNDATQAQQHAAAAADPARLERAAAPPQRVSRSLRAAARRRRRRPRAPRARRRAAAAREPQPPGAAAPGARAGDARRRLAGGVRRQHGGAGGRRARRGAPRAVQRAAARARRLVPEGARRALGRRAGARAGKQRARLLRQQRPRPAHALRHHGHGVRPSAEAQRDVQQVPAAAARRVALERARRRLPVRAGLAGRRRPRGRQLPRRQHQRRADTHGARARGGAAAVGPRGERAAALQEDRDAGHHGVPPRARLPQLRRRRARQPLPARQQRRAPEATESRDQGVGSQVERAARRRKAGEAGGDGGQRDRAECAGHFADADGGAAEQGEGGARGGGGARHSAGAAARRAGRRAIFVGGEAGEAHTAGGRVDPEGEGTEEEDRLARGGCGRRQGETLRGRGRLQTFRGRDRAGAAEGGAGRVAAAGVRAARAGGARQAGGGGRRAARAPRRRRGEGRHGRAAVPQDPRPKGQGDGEARDRRDQVQAELHRERRPHQGRGGGAAAARGAAVPRHARPAARAQPAHRRVQGLDGAPPQHGARGPAHHREAGPALFQRHAHRQRLLGQHGHRLRARAAGDRVHGPREQPRGGQHGVAVGRRALLQHRGLRHGAVGLRRGALLLPRRVRRVHGQRESAEGDGGAAEPRAQQPVAPVRVPHAAGRVLRHRGPADQHPRNGQPASLKYSVDLELMFDLCDPVDIHL